MQDNPLLFRSFFYFPSINLNLIERKSPYDTWKLNIDDFNIYINDLNKINWGI